jgi:hypothetical protein
VPTGGSLPFLPVCGRTVATGEVTPLAISVFLIGLSGFDI